MNNYQAGNYVTYNNKSWIVADIAALWTYLENPVTKEKATVATCRDEDSPIQLLDLPKCKRVRLNGAIMWETLKGHLVFRRMA